MLEYTGKRAFDFDTDCVSFLLEKGARHARGLISREALQDHFGAGEDFLGAFDQNAAQIVGLAIERDLHDPAPSGSVIVLRTGDF